MRRRTATTHDPGQPVSTPPPPTSSPPGKLSTSTARESYHLPINLQILALFKNQVMLVITHLVVATSLLEHRHTERMMPGEGLQSRQGISSSAVTPTEARAAARTTPGRPESQRPCRGELPAAPCLWTSWDRAYVTGAGVVWVFGELVHPWVFGPGRLPFLPLMGVSVFGAVGVVACWGLSAARVPASALTAR